jgi:2-phospho-L-lactate guanylyltransferase
MRAALVPVKALALGKSRLGRGLARTELERLVLAMLGDVVSALREVGELDLVAVVTPDARVAEEAQALGAAALLRDDPGLVAALDAAARELARRGLRDLLVVLGDVPAAQAPEVAKLFAALRGLGGRGVVLAPSRDGGTSALLRAPWDAIPNRFGKDSAAAHREAAQAAGLPYCELPLASLAVDLDRAEDAEALRDAPGAPRTRALLAELGIGLGARRRAARSARRRAAGAARRRPKGAGPR